MRLFTVSRAIRRSLYHLQAAIRWRLTRLTSFRRVRSRFHRVHGYPLDLETPRTFSERVVWRRLFVRDPLLVRTADKIRVREHVAEMLGREEADEILIPLLAEAEDPADLPFDEFTGPYIVKANHGRGSHIIVRDPRAVDRDAVVRAMRRQLSRVYGSKNHEWAYSRIPPRVLVEELLAGPDGGLPADYKFHMIHGVCAFIQVDLDRERAHVRTLYTPDWELIPVGLRLPRGPVQEAPAGLGYMLDVSRRLAAGLEYVRVDLYWTEGRVRFGEMTHYPASGHALFDPVSFDVELGRRWGELAQESASASTTRV